MNHAPAQTARRRQNFLLTVSGPIRYTIGNTGHKDEEGTWNPFRETAGGASCQDENVFPLRSDE